MSRLFYLTLILIAVGCEPAWEPTFEVFTIKKGHHYSKKTIQLLQSNTLYFDVIFDETAKYQALTKENQWDTHKLLGFSDCNSHHHKNSARFGWRWVDNELQIMAYCYTNGNRIIEPIGTVALNTVNTFRLTMTSNTYDFQLNHQTKISIERSANCSKGLYYMLFPYFGGNEVAPHDIHLQIRMIQS
ncbi:hypothetical protein [Marinoscillum furvescens]|uniref:Lipoprotein n=1 Tax=Marinoscillum furvescens DSM 4134 TaxID=1122208 RepID=A0A3D9L2T4_MARFU|nr:hypothetical protein [Marinoscillum furvescens]RED97002.1 hypothetical protein C7460_11350 [Marinoscillum furvescens DSM 4134]